MNNNKNNKTETRSIIAAHISGNDWKWNFRVPDYEIPAVKDIALTLFNTSNEQTLICPVLSVKEDRQGGSVIEADLSLLKETIDTCKTVRWKILLTVGKSIGHLDDKVYVLKGDCKGKSSDGKKKKKDLYKRRFDKVMDPVGMISLGDRTVEAVPDFVSGGEWMICVGDRCLRYMYALRCAGIDYKVTDDKLTFTVNCPIVGGIEWKGIVLAYRYRLEKDRKDYFFPVTKLTAGKGYITALIEVDIRGLELKPVNWDVRMVFEKNGERFWCHAMSPESDEAPESARSSQTGLRGLFAKQSVIIQDGSQLSLMCTDKGNTSVVVQQYTLYSGFRFRFKERLALLIYRLMRGSLRKKNIFLVYEKYCSMAQDNGFYFFKYCMENDMEKAMDRHIYYVIDKSRKDYANLEKYKDHVIQFMSLKHMVYLLAARLLVSSDSRKHAYAWRSTESVIRRKLLKEKKSVFLQHGVFGLKRSIEFKRGASGGTDLFIASNEMEKGFIMEDMGYKDEQVAVTGLARWDVLEDKSGSVSRKHILVMPTWRKWLEEVPDEIFLESEYYLRYMELINSGRLIDYLERNDLIMDFYIHPKFSEQIRQFSTGSDRVRLIPFGSEPLNEILMECSLLVTDYSSVCWDVYYQGKPVIFYQFDLDKYNEATGAYMDLEKDLFGDRAETQDELFTLMDEAAENEFKLKPEYEEMREDMFAFIDHNNSKRTCEAILKRGW